MRSLIIFMSILVSLSTGMLRMRRRNQVIVVNAAVVDLFGTDTATTKELFQLSSSTHQRGKVMMNDGDNTESQSSSSSSGGRQGQGRGRGNGNKNHEEVIVISSSNKDEKDGQEVSGPQECEHQDSQQDFDIGNDDRGDSEPRNTNTTMVLRLPNVLLIGVQKAGTSAIAKFIFNTIGACRPAVLKNEPAYFGKEAHFFDLAKKYNKGARFYSELYRSCDTREDVSSKPSSMLRLDATPATLTRADQVHETYQSIDDTNAQHNHLKIIVILREPVSRELSAYNHMRDLYLTEKNRTRSTSKPGWYHWVKRNSTDDEKDRWGCSDATACVKTFDEYVDSVTMPRATNPHLHPHENVGWYAQHLETWLHYFDRKQLLVLSYDEVQRDPSTLLYRIRSFLNITGGENNDSKRQQKLPVSNSHHSSNKVYTIECQTRDKLMRIYERWNEDLYQLLAHDDGPDEEQKPFPRFDVIKTINCTDD